ncbi:MAG: hypothetical protein KDA78_00760 [Planctomycetaceae bacterium]|nr:hypothetical protein [Planctomycetaceae bacterium]
MKALLLVYGIIFTAAASTFAQDDASLVPFIEKMKSASSSERVTGFNALSEYWKEPQEVFTGFSDTPIKITDRLPEKRIITDGDLDRIAKAIEGGIRESDADVRKAGAIALISLPRSSDSVQSAVLAGVKSDDPTVNWYVMQQRTNVWPKIDLVIDNLIDDLASHSSSKYYAARELMSRYGKQARPYSKRIVESIFDCEPDDDRDLKLYVLCDIGINEAAVNTLVSQAGRLTEEEAGIAAISLLDFPDALRSYSNQFPNLFRLLEQHNAQLFPFLCKHQYEPNKTREWLASSESLPVNIMGMLREPRFIKEIVKLEKNASSHRMTFLAACKRACGDKAELIIDVDAKRPVVFRPKSAWPNSDDSRINKTALEHGDGMTDVMVTGELRGDSGSHPQLVRFYRTNDDMLLGTEQDYEEPLLYDNKTGRFVFLTSVFAAYSTGIDQPEPGPYQTGSAQIRIEAPGFKPLLVQFFDEIPDLRITLEKQP